MTTTGSSLISVPSVRSVPSIAFVPSVPSVSSAPSVSSVEQAGPPPRTTAHGQSGPRARA